MSKQEQRKRIILQAVVEDYIENAQPIASADIKTKYLPNVSSATIRNDLSELEKEGFLEQLHTSSGRIPTQLAYSNYVANMMPDRALTNEETKTISSFFDDHVRKVGDVMTQVARAISEATQYPSVAYFEHEDEIVKSIKVVKISSNMALLVLVTVSGIVFDGTITLDQDYDDESFRIITEMISNVFDGKTILEIIRSEDTIRQSIAQYREFLERIFEFIKKFGSSQDSKIALEGASKLLEYPEYADVNKAKKIMELLDDKSTLMPILKSDNNSGVEIKITTDIDSNDCAMVTANYVADGHNVYKAGVIGPKRMDYSKVVSVLKFVCSNVFSKASRQIQNVQSKQIAKPNNPKDEQE